MSIQRSQTYPLSRHFDVCFANMTHDCFYGGGMQIELLLLIKLQTAKHSSILPHFSLSLSIFPQLAPSPVFCPCVETEGFWCCPRQWTIWVISCAPVSYDFVLRQRCSRAFCLAGLSHGSQTSLFLPFPFHVAMREWDESAAIVAWFSDLSIGSNDWGFDVHC